MAFTPITDAETDAGQPTKQELFKTGIKDNLNDHETRIATLEGAVSSAFPTGLMVPFGAAAAPTGWLECDGAAVNRITFADLFAVIGTTYGIGDGATTFNVPDLRGRVAAMLDGGTGRLSAVTSLADTDGAQTHTHTTVSHTHTVTSHNHQWHEGNVSGSLSGSYSSGGTATIWAGLDAAEGADTNHLPFGSSARKIDDAYTANAAPGTGSASPATNAGDSVQPTLGTNYIIKT